MAKKLLTLDLKTGQRKLETVIVDSNYEGDLREEVSYSAEAIDDKLKELDSTIDCKADMVIPVGSVVSYVSGSEDETIKVKPASFYEDNKIIGVTISEVIDGKVEVVTAGNVKNFIKQENREVFEEGNSCYVGKDGKVIQSLPEHLEEMKYIIPVGVLINDSTILLGFNQDDIVRVSDDAANFQVKDLIERDKIATDIKYEDNSLQLLNVDGAPIGTRVVLPSVQELLDIPNYANIQLKDEPMSNADIVILENVKYNYSLPLSAQVIRLNVDKLMGSKNNMVDEVIFTFMYAGEGFGTIDRVVCDDWSYSEIIWHNNQQPQLVDEHIYKVTLTRDMHYISGANVNEYRWFATIADFLPELNDDLVEDDLVEEEIDEMYEEDAYVYKVTINQPASIKVTSRQEGTNWGDGTINSETEHAYSEAGTYTIITKSAMLGFHGSITEIKLIKIPSNVYSLNNAFMNDSSLAKFDVSNNIDTSRISSMNRTFSGAGYMAAETVFQNLNKFDTRNVQDMGAVFSGCTKIKTLDLKGWNTDRVYSTGEMFMNCKALEYLDISTFNSSTFSNHPSCYTQMFVGVPSNCRVIVGPNWNLTEEQTGFAGTFTREQ